MPASMSKVLSRPENEKNAGMDISLVLGAWKIVAKVASSTIRIRNKQVSETKASFYKDWYLSAVTNFCCTNPTQSLPQQTPGSYNFF